MAGTEIRRVGKGALAPCPPTHRTKAKWWARLRFAHPTNLIVLVRTAPTTYSLAAWSIVGIQFRVMPCLVPGIHVLLSLFGDKGVDGRDKPGHDEEESFRDAGNERC